jgi:PAS domain S-box-containing protein
MQPDKQLFDRHAHELVQLREIEIKLKDNEDRLYQAIESAEVGIWDWFIKEDRLVWDNQMLELFGITQEEFTGNNQVFYERMHTEDIPVVAALVKKAIDTCGKFTYTYRVKTDDGNYVSITSKGSVLCDENGHAYRLVGVAWRSSECPRYQVCPVREVAISKLKAGAPYSEVLGLTPSSL